jgi:hypothetical protein
VEIGTLLVIVCTAWQWRPSSDRGISDNSPIAQVQA